MSRVGGTEVGEADPLDASFVHVAAELLEVLHELRTIDLANDTPEFREEYINKDRTVINLRGKINAEKNSLARPMFTLNPEADMKHAALVVIDECSMVDEPMGEDLLSFGTKVLVLGDPAQLPPIKGSGFFTDCEPDFMLTEIHRQARDNPIIHMATQVRLKKNLEIGSYGDSKVIDIRDVNKEMALEADQILVGRNKSRTMYNNRMRVLKGINDRDPVGGDRLVCLRNDHEVGLLNGAIWYVEDVDRIEGDRVYMTVRPEDGGDLLDVDSHRHYFLGIGDQLPWYERKEAQEFDYGYALTVHKSQGSQWDCTLLFDEGDCFRQHKWKWRYTGLTRAAETVTVVVN